MLPGRFYCIHLDKIKQIRLNVAQTIQILQFLEYKQPDRYPFLMPCDIIFVAGRIKHCLDHSNYIFLRILENKTDILVH